MQTRWKYNHLICAFSLFVLVSHSYAQISMLPINHQKEGKKSVSSRAIIQNDTISLPLWDDFSDTNRSESASIWQNLEQVYINNGLAYLPPSYNVASFDGFDSTGTAYSSESDQLGIGDSLVSKSIDLSSYTTNDNINLSFFWQEGFGPTAPDSEDSLRVFFKNRDNQWVYINSFGGHGRSEPLPFQQSFASVNNEMFFHEGFQFKFEYYGNLAGEFDLWNIDYVYLNEGNTRVTTTNFRYDSYEDRTFSSMPEGIFSGYYGIPLKHITPDFMQEIIQPGKIIYNNLWAGNGASTIFGTQIFGSLYGTLNPKSLVDSIFVNGNFLTQAQDTALFSIQARNNQAIIDYLVNRQEAEDSVFLAMQFNLGNTDSLFFESINGTATYYPFYSFKQNDTIKQVTSFHDYYALDDGTAEASIQLNSKSYELAQYFKINGEYYLTAIDMYIPNIAQNSSTQNITLLILNDLSSNDGEGSIIAAQNVLVASSEKQNKFQRFQLDNPVLIREEMYIGYREENDEVVSVGFDKNSNSAIELYYNQSGTWQKNELLTGSIMMRPVFGPLNDVLSNHEKEIRQPLVVYPNPSKGIIYFNQSFDQLNVYGLDGQLHLTKNSSYRDGENSAVDLSALNNGLYFIQMISKGQEFTTKILIKK